VKREVCRKAGFDHLQIRQPDSVSLTGCRMMRRIERYSEELKSFEYRFTPCVFSLKWARVGSDAPKGGRGGGAAQGHAETAEVVELT
jgi:hypothetical protein